MALSLAQINRIASLATIPLMLLAILAFSRAAGREPEIPLPSEGTVVIASLRAESLTFHNFATGRATTLALPGPPHELLALDARLYVTLGRANLVAEVDPAGPAILRLLELPGEPHGITARDGLLLVTLDRANALVTIDPRTFAEVSRQPTGETPHLVASGPTGVFVIDSRDDALRRIEPAPVTAPTGGLPEGLAIAGSTIATADYFSGTVSLFDAGTLSAAGSISVGGGPVRVIAIGASHLAVATQVSPRLLVIDVASREIERAIPVPARPDGICPSPDGAHLAVVSNAENSVTLLATESWRTAGALTAGDGPGACIWLPSR